MKKSLPVLLLATAVPSVQAQVFQPPSAYEFVYGDPGVKFPQSTSCHSMRASAAYFPVLGLGSADLYIAAWNDPDPGMLSEVTVLITLSNDPTTVLWNGSILYSDVQGLEVGSIRNMSTNQTSILAAYYRPGVGYFLDEHGIDASGNVFLISNTLLANSPTYGRIRMDFHSLWSGAVAWINTDPSVNAIQAQVYDNNTWSATSTFNATADKKDMDLSLEHIDLTIGNSYKELHLTYADDNFITESALNFQTLHTSPGVHTPAINDNDFIGGMYISRINMDCPGFSINGSRWAYTYTDNNDVFVRYRDPAVAGGVPQTSIVTAGMPGNAPITGQYKMFSPALNYEFMSFSFGVPNDIMVTWYATDGVGFNRYIGLKIDPFGNLASAGDYLDLPNAQTPALANPFFSGIAMTRTDAKSPAPFSYTTYFDMNPVTGRYQLHHAFHDWGNPLFRGLPVEEEVTGNTTISSYPNPFQDQLNLSLELQENSIVELLLTDINGRTVARTNQALTQGKHQVKIEALGQLPAGNYILTTLINQKKASVQKVTKN